MNRNDYILIIDSGNGGEYVLNQLIKDFPNENFLFFKDINNCPYGNKGKKKLLKITINNINYFIKSYNVKLIVFACNTISCTILDKLKKRYNDICLLGLIPNIEDTVKTGEKTLVLSTHSTLKRGKINKGYKRNKNIKFLGFKDLAKRIDENINHLDNLIPFLRKKLSKYISYKNIVIGCSHFSLIEKQLKIATNHDIEFFNNIDKLRFNLKNTSNALSLDNKQKKVGKVIIQTKIKKE